MQRAASFAEGPSRTALLVSSRLCSAPLRKCSALRVVRQGSDYSIMLATTPAPPVRPPSARLLFWRLVDLVAGRCTDAGKTALFKPEFLRQSRRQGRYPGMENKTATGRR